MGNEQRRPDALFFLAAIGLALALILGGGTRDGFLSDAILQACAVPLLLVCLWRLATTPTTKEIKRAALFCALVVLVPLLQVVPLPPAIWTRLPDRQPITETFALLGRPLPWRPLSVLPQATWLSALSLLVPLAIFLATALLGFRERRWLSLVMLAIGLASVFLGLSQVAEGPTSPLRFFEFSNKTEAIGFFANRNHFAALLYSLALFAAAWAVSVDGGGKSLRKKYDSATLVPMVASFTVLAVLVAAQAVARSRAGLGLTIVALAGAFALAAARRRNAGRSSGTNVLVAAIALAVMFAVQFALYRIRERFATDPLEDARIQFAHVTFAAARAFMPFGSGMGTFTRVYGLFEKPQDLLANTFANRAHNDPLEVGLEAGAVGLALMAAFAAWLVARAIVLWGRKAYGEAAVDQALARAATLVLALLIAHSFVDYPLRTGAMMAVFAFACGLLLAPLPSSASAAAQTFEPVSKTVPQPSWPSPEDYGLGEGLGDMSSRGTRRWGEGMEWPEEWRTRPKPKEK